MGSYRHILITGGAGFVGSSLAIALKQDFNNVRVTALDNLKRRGSELALGRLATHGVEFQHGDIRNPEDIVQAGSFDLLIECSAEPSVHAGYGSSPTYLISTNLVGTTHCLEAARIHHADVVFLSTSRVYPIKSLRELPVATAGLRLDLAPDQSGAGWSGQGISEDFPLHGPRSLYGATKLASELLLTEYSEMYGIRSIINRCGVLTGPWQMGKVDQGFMALWAAQHLYGGNLAYMGFGGHGHQVRDILHVADLYALLRAQFEQIDKINGQIFNVGGGRNISVSLAELTDLCTSRSGKRLDIAADPETRDADIPWYITDTRAVTETTGWQPRYDVESILDDIFAWLGDNRAQLEPILKA